LKNEIEKRQKEGSPERKEAIEAKPDDTELTETNVNAQQSAVQS
jgi:hypothetical protein